VPSVSAVLLDVGGVFLLPPPEVMLPPLRAAGVHPGLADLQRAHYKATAAVESVPEQQRWLSYLRAYATASGVGTVRAAAVAAELDRAFEGSTWQHVIPGCTDGLREIAALGVPLGIVSNSTGTVEAELAGLRICQTGPGDGTEVGTVIDSAVVGVQKPDPRIFALALEKLGIGHDGVVHVGDTVRFDVEGAQAAGIRPFHLDPYGDCPAPGGHEHIRRLADLPGMIRS
jgi:putative hydrolase of the HAD superfamily